MYERVLTEDVLRRKYSAAGMTKAEIAREFGVTVHTVNKYLRRHNIPRNPMWVYRSEDFSGKRFGRLTVVGRGPSDRHRKCTWVCTCSCDPNVRVTVNASSLKRGLTQSCGCLKHDLAHHGWGDISVSFWRKTQRTAADRGVGFTITPEYVWGVYESQGRRCAYTDLPVVFCPDSNKPQRQTASIDRIDSFSGYVEGNVQIVHKTVNMMKSWLPDKEFVALCNLVAKKRNMPHEDCVNRAARTIFRKIRP